MRPANLVFILSDEHSRDALGCYEHPVVQTPNLNRLAAQGTRFTNAYTPCPICVPARVSLATGRYVHQTENWDNAFPYVGEIPSWGHRLREQGFHTASIGKLHFRSQSDDNGFAEEILPLHVVEGVGDLLGCIRDAPPFRKKRLGITSAGPGNSSYLQYDARITDHACQWLVEHKDDGKPWVLFISFVCPHPPYIAPKELYDLYPLDKVPLPPQWWSDEWPDHPAMNYFRRFFDFAEPFDEQIIRNVTAAYYGLCTYLDQQIGAILRVLEENKLNDRTRILYTSDHGESLGARGIFGKFTMYDEAAAVPFILAGPEVPECQTVSTPISLVDCFPTIVEGVGASLAGEDVDLPGRSLWSMAWQPEDDRTVFSEYHAVGSRNAIFMLRNRRFKYVHYIEAQPQLFDLLSDPKESKDLASSQAHQPVLHDFERQLHTLLNPKATDARAKADQRAKIEDFGGREAVCQRGTFVNSPVPGEEVEFVERVLL